MGQKGSEAFDISIAIWIRGIIANLPLLDRLRGRIPARLRPIAARRLGMASDPAPDLRRRGIRTATSVSANPARPSRSEGGIGPGDGAPKCGIYPPVCRRSVKLCLTSRSQTGGDVRSAWMETDTREGPAIRVERGVPIRVAK